MQVEFFESGADACERLSTFHAQLTAMAREALNNDQFDLKVELGKPWVRSWFSSEDPRSCPLGMLISWHVADELHILSVAVDPQARRRGIGRALLRSALEYAKHREIRLLLLEVRRSNRAAIRLYRAFSFTALGVRPNYYADTGEDAVEMVLTIDPVSGDVRAARDEVRLED